jgi:hypothetical protein
VTQQDLSRRVESEKGLEPEFIQGTLLKPEEKIMHHRE